ncbi:hypothetical protein G3N57_15140 [Paraburkholderia sp. Se-20369]|nr:hypothetical protein [Paraburkholderia sp. Se-20369]
MNALGIVSESSTRTAGNRPPFIPSFGFHERHQSRPIDAPAPARSADPYLLARSTLWIPASSN